MLDRAPHSRINLLRSPSKCFVDKRLADAAVGTRNQNGFVFNIHRLLLSGCLLLLRLWGPGGYGVKDYLKCRVGIGWRSRDTQPESMSPHEFLHVSRAASRPY